MTAIQVRPTGGTPASGNITRTGGSGTAIAGITAGSNFGTLTSVVGAVAQLGITTEPATATAGAVFGQQPVVRTEDQFGNASTTSLGNPVNVTAAINAGSGPLQGTAVLDIGTAGGNGTITDTDLRMDVAQTGATLDFTAAGLATATSAAFNVGHGAATKHILTTPPSASSAPGVAFAQQPVITIQDAFSNTVTSDSSTVVTAALTTGTGTLAGTVTETAASGIADFVGNGLAIDLSGTDKVLTFTGGALTPAVSGAFTIAAGGASEATSTISASPATLIANGSDVSTITVQLKDAGSTNLASGGDTVTLSTDIGTLSTVTDNGDGTYTATLTSLGTGTATISGTVNSATIVDTASLLISAVSVPPPPPPAQTADAPGIQVALDKVTSGPASIVAKVVLTVLASDGSEATVTVPAAALPDGSTFEVGSIADADDLEAQTTPPAGVDVILGFSLTAADAAGAAVTSNFNSPVTLEFTVDAGTLPSGAGAAELRIAFWNGTDWVPLASAVTVNADGSATLNADTDHFSVYSVVYDAAGFGRLVGDVPPTGIGFVAFGGSIAELQTAMVAASCSTPAFATNNGAWVGYLPNAPFAAINADFDALFGEGIPLGRPLVLSNCG